MAKEVTDTPLVRVRATPPAKPSTYPTPTVFEELVVCETPISWATSSVCVSVDLQRGQFMAMPLASGAPPEFSSRRSINAPASSLVASSAMISDLRAVSIADALFDELEKKGDAR